MNALSCLAEIAGHFRNASDRLETVNQSAPPSNAPIERRGSHEKLTVAILDEIEAWRSIGLSRAAVNLEDAAYQLGMLFDFLLTVTEDGRFEEIEDETVKRDLTTISRVVAGVTLCVADVAGIDLDAIDLCLRSRVVARAPKFEASAPLA